MDDPNILHIAERRLISLPACAGQYKTAGTQTISHPPKSHSVLCNPHIHIPFSLFAMLGFDTFIVHSSSSLTIGHGAGIYSLILARILGDC